MAVLVWVSFREAFLTARLTKKHKAAPFKIDDRDIGLESWACLLLYAKKKI